MDERTGNQTNGHHELCICSFCSAQRDVKETVSIIPGPGPSEQMRENIKGRMKGESEVCVGCARAGACKTKDPALEDLKECCYEMRKDLLVLVDHLAGLIENHPAMMTGVTVAPGEWRGRNPNNARSHAVLGFRALEDARMRLGKVVQMLDGGKSILER